MKTSPRVLRSTAWFDGDTEVALMHRVALANSGIQVDPANPRPLIGILDSSSPINPCNLPLRALGEAAARGVEDAGGIALTLPTMTLGEDLMKPTAMLYRSLLSMEVEEYARAYPLDGLLILGNCDKSLPGALMGAASSNLPTMMVNAGARAAGRSARTGEALGTGTALWRAEQERRAGALDDRGWQEFERALACGPGSCNTMGPASSMASVLEVLGFLLPGSSTPPTLDPRRSGHAREAGAAIVAAVWENRTPDTLLTPAALDNALTALCALGGSPNVVLHLTAIAARRGYRLPPNRLDEIARRTPVIADVQPAGAHLLEEFDAAGGVPALLHALGERIDTAQLTATGAPWSAAITAAVGPAIRSADTPLTDGPAFAVLVGNLAPRGALLRVATATAALTGRDAPPDSVAAVPCDLSTHRGPAVVFHNYEEMVQRCADPLYEIAEDSVLVLAGAGPVGAGMPEWGVLPIPVALARRGVRDMVRLSDARMSGTAFGTCIVHVSPEAAIGGPLGLVREGDIISLDVAARSLHLEVSEEELERRAQEGAGRVSTIAAAHLRGWPLLYREHVLQADEGADLDFLTAPTPAHRLFREPVIGLS